MNFNECVCTNLYNTTIFAGELPTDSGYQTLQHELQSTTSSISSTVVSTYFFSQISFRVSPTFNLGGNEFKERQVGSLQPPSPAAVASTQQQPQQQQPPVATSAPAPVVTAPGVVAPSPLVYQQLASGQIQMYQLPPGYVPVLVSNTGSLQPLVSLPPQPQIPQPQPPIDSLGVPADNNSRRSSSNMQGYEYAAPMQMMIVPEQQQQQQQQPQPQPQMVQAEQQQAQPPMPMEYAANQPQMIPVTEAYQQPSVVMQPQQPQMVSVPEPYSGQPVQTETYVQPAQQQPSMVMPPQPQPQQMVPDVYAAGQQQPPPMSVVPPESYVQPQPPQVTPAEPYVQPTASDAYVHVQPPQIPIQATEPEPQMVHTDPEEVHHAPEAEHLPAQQSEETVEDSGTAAVTEDLEAVEGEDGLEEGLDDSVKPDVSGLPGCHNPVATHQYGYVVHPVAHQHVQYHHQYPHSVSSSTLYSGTSMSSLSSSCDYLSHAPPSYKHSVSLEEQARTAPYQQHQQRKNSAGPVIGQPTHASSLIAANDNALLRRGSLPHTILLMKQDFPITSTTALGSNSRRSSSGTVVPLATLREKAGDSDMSNEDLSQVSLGPISLFWWCETMNQTLFSFPDFCDRSIRSLFNQLL